MNRRIIFALCIAVLVSGISQRLANANARDNGVEVTFRVISCPNYAGTPPTIKLSTLPLLHDRTLDVTPTFAGGIWTFVTSLEPKKYFMAALGGLYCGFNGSFTVLPDHKRAIAVVLGPGLLITDNTDSLAGVLPFDGLGVSLVSSGGKEVAAVVEDRAYYFDLLKDGRYTLKVLVQNRDYMDIPVKVHGSLTRRDVTLNDLLTAEPI